VPREYRRALAEIDAGTVAPLGGSGA